MELLDSEERRAVNVIWNAARDYGFTPEFKAFDAEGRAELYWNCIIGAVRRWFDWSQIKDLLASFRDTPRQETYENLLWLGLENAAYLRECGQRPALPSLRREYARRGVAQARPQPNPTLQNTLAEAHFRRVLGEDPALERSERELLDALEFGADATTEEIVSRTQALFRERLGFAPAEEKPEETKKKSRLWPVLALGRKRRGMRGGLSAVRSFAFGLGEHADEYGGAESAESRKTFQMARFTDQTEESLRSYIMRYFGTPLYDDWKLREMEKSLCCGNHRGCRLYFTRGSYEGSEAVKGYVAAQRKAVVEQHEKNQKFYEAHLARNRNSINRLTNRIRNSLLTHLEVSEVRAGTGRLEAGRIWRGLYLDDDRIFRRELRSDAGNLSVDILLDASTSQLHRQETVATQGYIIAESLTRCGLPVRVYSFCSMSGYTVVNLFRDYGEKDKNGEIFRYFTTGCNRDGLAVRIAAQMLGKTACEHKLLILLSDAKPNDVVKVDTGGAYLQDYAEQMGVEDTAAEVHRARLDGISVVCVFTGEDADLPAARKIYGQDFSRIRSLEQFADTVGALIQSQIRNL